jgi:hypothetical protein
MMQSAAWDGRMAIPARTEGEDFYHACRKLIAVRRLHCSNVFPSKWFSVDDIARRQRGNGTGLTPSAHQNRRSTAGYAHVDGHRWSVVMRERGESRFSKK